MGKKDNNEITIIDDLGLSPDILDQKHHVIPIVAGGDDDVVEEVQLPEVLPILTLLSCSNLILFYIKSVTLYRYKLSVGHCSPLTSMSYWLLVVIFFL